MAVLSGFGRRVRIGRGCRVEDLNINQSKRSRAIKVRDDDVGLFEEERALTKDEARHLPMRAGSFSNYAEVTPLPNVGELIPDHVGDRAVQSEAFGASDKVPRIVT